MSAQFKAPAEWLNDGDGFKFPDRATVDKYYFEQANMRKSQRKITGGFLQGGRAAASGRKKDGQCSIQSYFLEAKQDGVSDNWTSKNGHERIVKAHEKWIRRLCQQRGTLTFDYAIDTEKDVTSGSKVCVSDIKNEMSKALQRGWLGKGMSGITSAWTYYPADSSHFAMHLEDGDALSFNVNLKGGCKYWITVLPEDKKLLETRVAEIVRNAKYGEQCDRKKAQCEDVLRHKEHYFPIRFLERIGVKFYVVPQEVGDIIVTLPHCYHQGFQAGESINVAMNMLCKWWLIYGVTASHVSDRAKRKDN